MPDSLAVDVLERRRFGRLPALLLLLALVYVGTAAAEPSCTDSDYENDKQKPEAVPDTRYEVRDGVVTDQSTGLMWKRCSEGQQWNGDTCSGSPKEFDWKGAQKRAKDVNAGKVGHKYQFSDWRVPTQDELASLMADHCKEPAINTAIFPNTASSKYWSSTPADVANNANYGYFKTGLVGGKTFKSSTLHVRLVRGGQ